MKASSQQIEKVAIKIPKSVINSKADQDKATIQKINTNKCTKTLEKVFRFSNESDVKTSHCSIRTLQDDVQWWQSLSQFHLDRR